uniref:diisopropyl-fluorophosphatase-like n=1 Tax=Ciona intestinalis TaxID=7719 RepID=UPI000180C8A6|nr:diisopropyl-fluorophosphatase-like [Ciona intestinalis]|eukprot:XP_002120441.1 diisopropyl-fluorophosphatase-like [Ciona intestinalis]
MGELHQPRFTLITKGLAGAEGPVFDTKGRFYAVAPLEQASNDRETGQFTDGSAGKLYRIELETGDKHVVCTPHVEGFGGKPNGSISDKDDCIWCADMRLGLVKFDPGDNSCKIYGKVDSSGNPLNGANDLVFDDDGNLWFTGPGSPVAPAKEDMVTIFEVPSGKLYCLPKGEDVPVLADDNLRFPNGLAVQGKVLLVGVTVTKEILAYDIIGAGKLTNRRLWAKVPREGLEPGSFLGETDGPDGMDFDVMGRLLVANHGGSHIEVYPPDGGNAPIIRIRCPFEAPSNLHFRQNSNVCYVTEHSNDALWSFEWECRGAAMYCDK